MFRNTLLHIFLKSFFRIVKWFIYKKTSTKVIFFKIPSSVLLANTDYSIPKTVSLRIDQLQTVDLSKLSKDDVFNNDENINIKKLLKISWLLNSLREKGNINPIQLLQSKNGKYFCHPGSDRIMVMTYIDPVETVLGFYIWYPELDEKPFVLDYEHTIVNNPFTFISKFKFNKHLIFKMTKMNKQLNVSDRVDGNAMFNTAKECFEKTGKEYSVNFLSYYDSTQWSELKNNFDINNYITVSKDEIRLSNIKFKKVNDKWLPEYDQH